MSAPFIDVLCVVAAVALYWTWAEWDHRRELRHGPPRVGWSGPSTRVSGEVARPARGTVDAGGPGRFRSVR